MPQNVTIIFGLAGGLALFLFGMNAMSEALQKAAGEKMKKVLQFLTKNPVMGALAGALVTAVLQSSPATTVMVIGFVSAGLIGLPQAISVIFGANIGTTMTAQLIAFKISDYIYPIIFIGFLMTFLAKKERTKNIGMVIFSFGVLFEGIEIMSGVMSPLASSPFFTDLMGKVKDIPVLGIFLCRTDMLGRNAPDQSRKIARTKNRLRKTLKTFNKNHLARIRAKKCDESMTPVYSAILYNINRMGDNSVAIAEEALNHVYYLLPEQNVDADTGTQNLLIEDVAGTEQDSGTKRKKMSNIRYVQGTTDEIAVPHKQRRFAGNEANRSRTFPILLRF